MGTNNIPTDDVVFEPMGPSDIPSIIADVEEREANPYEESDPAHDVWAMILSMQPHRKVMMAMLRYCSDPVKVSDLYAMVEDMQVYYPSVYKAADFCELLEECEAFERVNADGSAYDAAALDPIIMEDEKGDRYYMANEPNDLYWVTTDAGQAYLDGDDPLSRAQGYFDEDEEYQPLYKRIMKLCQGEGVVLDVLNEAIDDDPLVVSEDPVVTQQKVYAPFFIDRLERADCIEWEGTWKLTDVGEEALALLDGVEDDYEAPAATEGEAES